MRTSGDDQAVFVLRNAEIAGPEGKVLRGLDLEVRHQEVLALLGPAGVGKSVLLRALATGGVPDGWLLSGCARRVGAGEVRYVAQRAGGSAEAAAELDEALASEARVVCLDEPDRVVGADAVRELASRLRAAAGERTIVMITHNLELARAASDRCALLCAGALIACDETQRMFEEPPNELVARFVRQGSCWPQAEPPALPPYFRWVEPGRLAGTGRPGLLRDADEDLGAMALSGISLLVCLTERHQPDAHHVRSFGIEPYHFPIRDMDVPGINPTASVCRLIERAMGRGEAVAVHCQAGLGRTGTVLAAMLVWRGAGAAEAIERVRAVNPAYIQTRAQESFVERFAETMGAP